MLIDPKDVNPSRHFTEVLKNPAQYNEAVLDSLIRAGRDVTDGEVIWGEVRPLGAERVADLSRMVFLETGWHVTRGPSPDERREWARHLEPGDRLSPLSRPTQWVWTTTRGARTVAWYIQAPAGAQDSPDESVWSGDGLEVFLLTKASHLRLEGATLGHCVGSRSAGYIHDVKSGACSIYSVRQDKKPLCTIEVRSGRVVQTQGKAGRPKENIPGVAEAWGRFVESGGLA